MNVYLNNSISNSSDSIGSESVPLLQLTGEPFKALHSANRIVRLEHL